MGVCAIVSPCGQHVIGICGSCTFNHACLHHDAPCTMLHPDTRTMTICAAPCMPPTAAVVPRLPSEPAA